MNPFAMIKLYVGTWTHKIFLFTQIFIAHGIFVHLFDIHDLAIYIKLESVVHITDRDKQIVYIGRSRGNDR